MVLNSDILPGDLAYTIDDITLLRENPEGDVDPNTGMLLKHWHITYHGEGMLLRANTPVLIIQRLPAESMTDEDIMGSVVLVLARETYGWLYAQELYGRISLTSRDTYVGEDPGCYQAISSSVGSGGTFGLTVSDW